MKIKTIYNCEIDSQGKIISQPSVGLKITCFNIYFDEKITSFTKDHCDCIQSSVVFLDSEMQVSLATEKNNIDEYLIFTAYNDLKKIGSLKIRFKR